MSRIAGVLVLVAGILGPSFDGAECRSHAASEDSPLSSLVHFVSSCHLDVGYGDLAVQVVNKYFETYYPASIKTSEELRHRGGEERLVFLTHTYLVSLYMDCPPNMGISCPSEADKSNFSAAVKRGDIVWHAMPFNYEVSLLDASMAEFSIQLTHDLDAFFGRQRTITMSQRDVPGMTRAIIPLLKKMGVEAVTVGVNGGSMPPAVPPIFRWLDPISGESVIAMWHPHGYGGQMCCTAADSVVVNGSGSALVFGIRDDNSGPPLSPELISDFAKIRKLFPGAKVVATDYDAFVRRILPHAHDLPVYDKEIGDTWIYGVASDPFRAAAARLMMAARTHCLASGQCNLSDYRIYNFSRLLMKASEHTWGLAFNGNLQDQINFLNPQFHAVMNEWNYVFVASSWREQREWGVFYPLEALADHPLADELRPVLEELRNVSTPDTHGYTRVTQTQQVFTVGDVKLSFSEAPYSIDYLSVNGVEYANSATATKLGALLYQSFNATDFDHFMAQYLDSSDIHFWEPGFGKPGLSKVVGVKRQEIYGTLEEVWMKRVAVRSGSASFLLRLSFPPSLVRDYGAPADTWVELTVSQKTLDFSVMLLNKTATRLPESISFQFKPLVRNVSSMTMDKLGQVFSVLDVGVNGSKHLHAVGHNGISYTSNPDLKFLSKHVPLVCIGKPTPFPTPMEAPDLNEGFAFNIINNIWGTNYIMWYPFDKGDGSFRSDFRIDLPSHEP